MARIPSEVSGLLRDLSANLPILLRGNLVGIYQYGSLTQHAFNPKRSDIDCIVVTRRDLSDAQFKRLRTWLTEAARSNPWTTRLQMTMLIRDEVLTKNSWECLYQFGQLTRLRSDGNPIIWINVLESGVVLYGPRAETFVAPITPKIFLAALKREVGYLRDEMMGKPNSEWRDVPFYRAYAVLTLCRILYSHAMGTVVSKPRAARWAIEQLPKKLQEIVLQALHNDRHGHTEKRSANISLSRIRKLIVLVDARLTTHDNRRKPIRRNEGARSAAWR
jgi:hypothetical protein